MKRDLLYALLGIALSLPAISTQAQDITELISPKNDVTLRSDNPDKAFPTNNALEMYTLRNEDNSIKTDFVGLMSFQIPVKDGYSVKSADLKLVTERAKGSVAIYALGADVSDADTYNSQKESVADARTKEPIAVVNLRGTSGKATFDGGASSNLEDWVNHIDVTDYVQTIGDGRINLLLVNNAKSTGTSVQVYTSDAQDVTNTRVVPNFTFRAEDLKPILTVVYEKDENKKIDVSTSTADTWVYRGNNGKFGNDSAVELAYELGEDNSVKKEIDGLMSFQLPALALSADYSIESVTLRLVSERVKGNRYVNVYGYQAFEENTNFANEEDNIKTAKVDDNLICSFEAKGAPTAMPYDALSDSYKTVDAWTNYIDLTNYVTKQKSQQIHLLLAKKNSSLESTKFYSKDLSEDVVNAKDASLVFKKEDLIPQLTVVYTKAGTSGVEKVSVNVPASDNGKVYNLQGVQMNGGKLPAGIYVKNGKKFIVK